MKHKMELNSELILNVTRILILLSYFGNQKSIKMTLNKIMMFDFYMKYPRVMIENTEIIDNNFDYYDYYSYYHWKPNRDEYHLYLRYLSAKRLITRTISNNDFIYQISKEGIDVVENLNSSYSVSLLPYVRGKKYSNIGSLGSVTMLTMAYYLSVLLVGIEDQNNHPGLLIIDTPRKNLGADPGKDETLFKDEEIYNSIIRFFIKLDMEQGDKLQLIIINNGYPEFLSRELVVAEFDGDGSKGLAYGLIDDAEG